MSRKTKLSHEEMLAKRRADDVRRSRAKAPEIPRIPLYNPGTMLYNPFKPALRSPGGIVLPRPGK